MRLNADVKDNQHMTARLSMMDLAVGAVSLKLV
jgi:hypothetical protein